MAFNAKQTAIDKRMEKTAKNILLFLENKTEDYENRVAVFNVCSNNPHLRKS